MKKNRYSFELASIQITLVTMSKIHFNFNHPGCFVYAICGDCMVLTFPPCTNLLEVGRHQEEKHLKLQTNATELAQASFLLPSPS